MASETWLVVCFPILVVFGCGALKWIVRGRFKASDFHLGIDLCVVAMATIIAVAVDANTRAGKKLLTLEEYLELNEKLLYWGTAGFAFVIVLTIVHQKYDEENHDKMTAELYFGSPTFWILFVGCNVFSGAYFASFLHLVARF